ncbi:MAG: glutamate--tRNA ligase [Patescibacteria group bacterium]|nr:glutamate--tRNA ligase [Patescibacteria group bacterium]
MAQKRIRLRAAPSPTGYMHIGNLRTYIYDLLLAKQTGGDFILRIEDTDQSRFVEGATVNLCKTLKRLGIVPNEGVWLAEDGETLMQRGEFGPYIQSERKAKHQKYAQKLLDMDKAYYCFCTEDRLAEMRKLQEATHQPTGYDGHCRKLDIGEAKKRVEAGESHVVRLKLPKEGSVVIDDAIRGKVNFDWKLIDDQVIVKQDGMATYHLASMVDDHDMEITHVLRGEEWLSSAPKHIFIYQAFGWEVPIFAHLPLLLNPDRTKLSKRQGDVSVESYLDKGYLPQTLINFLALCGWNPSDKQEIYSIEELTRLFNLSKVNKSGAIFNLEKLNWLNNHYLREMDVNDYLKLVDMHLPRDEKDVDFKGRIALMFRDRLNVPSDITELSSFMFKSTLDYAATTLTWKDHSVEEAVERMETVRQWIEQIDDSKLKEVKSVEEDIKSKIVDKGWGNGDTLWPLRVALSGQDKSPSPFELIVAYGKERTLARIDEAVAYLLK